MDYLRTTKCDALWHVTNAAFQIHGPPSSAAQCTLQYPQSVSAVLDFQMLGAESHWNLLYNLSCIGKVEWLMVRVDEFHWLKSQRQPGTNMTNCINLEVLYLFLE